MFVEEWTVAQWELVSPQVEAVEAILEQERKASNAKDARHKLTVERLRQKLVELQVIDSILCLHMHQQCLHLEAIV